MVQYSSPLFAVVSIYTYNSLNIQTYSISIRWLVTDNIFSFFPQREFEPTQIGTLQRNLVSLVKIQYMSNM